MTVNLGRCWSGRLVFDVAKTRGPLFAWRYNGVYILFVLHFGGCQSVRGKLARRVGILSLPPSGFSLVQVTRGAGAGGRADGALSMKPCVRVRNLMQVCQITMTTKTTTQTITTVTNNQLQQLTNNDSNHKQHEQPTNEQQRVPRVNDRTNETSSPPRRFIVQHSGVRDPSTIPATATTDTGGFSPNFSRPAWQGRVLVHSLFESLCQGCFEKHWRRKISACRGIRKACAVMNWQTARAFEFKLMQVRA